MNNNEWLPVADIIPPDVDLELMDEHGNIGYGRATWYPFRVEPDPNKTGIWTSKVVHCEPYWNGGWLIAVKPGSLTDTGIEGRITHFRIILKNE